MYRTLAFLALLGSPALTASTVKQLFNFTTFVDIENSHLRPDGHLLLSTVTSGTLYQIDPASSNPEAEVVAELPGATFLTGIATIGADKYAVIGAVRDGPDAFTTTNGTIYTVEFAKGQPNTTVGIAATLPDAVLLNGVDSLPAHPNIILTSDSSSACIWRVDTDTGAVEKVIEDEAFNVTANATVPVGVDGLKIFNGSVYFTNAERATFGRVAITDDGYPAGEIEIIATLNDTVGGLWDDFAIDPTTGIAYVAQPGSAVTSIAPNGTQTIVFNGGNSSLLVGPTSITLGLDKTTAYVTTSGGTVGTSTFVYSGQVVEFTL
ncbi:hypothetical protein PENSPDRAFT_657084 [Peniophora sp. CONT]|nr:hypothetical protein PENSPDRAFT_657084 [Peniophora sp. CONT]